MRKVKGHKPITLWVVQEGPGEAAVAALGEATETPERLWTPAMRAATAEELAHLAAQAHAAQVTFGPFTFWVTCAPSPYGWLVHPVQPSAGVFGHSSHEASYVPLCISCHSI